MTVEIDGQPHKLSNDYWPDQGQWWEWAGPAPVCPRCGTLFTSSGDDYYVYPTRRGVFEFACGVCDKTFPVTEE